MGFLSFFLLFFIINFNTIQSEDLIARIYCKLLGDKDIKQEYKALTHQALKSYGIVNPEQVAIKKMNDVGSIIALMPVSSFTAFGIWFDEEYLDACSEEERIFQIYHEAAHYAKKHHQKLLVAASSLSLATIGSLILLNKKLKENKIAYASSITAFSSLVSAIGIYLGVLPYIVKYQEKEADIEAAKQMLLIDKNIVEMQIRNLEKYKSPNNGNLWWFSPKEQAEYLKQVIQ